MFIRKLPIMALVALAAACGGGDDTADTATTDTSTTAPTTGTTTTPAGDAVVVQVTTTANGASGTFEPQNVTVRRGQTIRWVIQPGPVVAAHNVSFTTAQGNPAGFTPPADSPYIQNPGDQFEMAVDLPAGTYNYTCTPHAAMGMNGTITVTE